MVRSILITVTAGIICGCSSLEPLAISSNDIGIQDSLIFSSAPTDVIQATKESLEVKKWKLLYEGETLPDKDYSQFSNMSHNPFSEGTSENFDQMAIDKVLRADMAPSYYLQAKTPTSAVSYGAELFVVVYESQSHGSALAISASSGQAREKGKLDSYIQELAALVKERVE